MIKKYSTLATKAAALSKCNKRKVGATVVGGLDGESYHSACNYNSAKGACEDANGRTKSTVVHAECAALAGYTLIYPEHPPTAIYVTHAPCNNCREAIYSAGITDANIHVVEQFLKFDRGKIRVDLLPMLAKRYATSPRLRLFITATNQRTVHTLDVLIQKLLEHATLLDAANVLTYGAKKYKPNNWRNVEDIDRYWAALGRHIIAEDDTDKESGLSHAAHALTNALFILELTYGEQDAC